MAKLTKLRVVIFRPILPEIRNNIFKLWVMRPLASSFSTIVIREFTFRKRFLWYQKKTFKKTKAKRTQMPHSISRSGLYILHTFLESFEVDKGKEKEASSSFWPTWLLSATTRYLCPSSWKSSDVFPTIVGNYDHRSYTIGH